MFRWTPSKVWARRAPVPGCMARRLIVPALRRLQRMIRKGFTPRLSPPPCRAYGPYSRDTRGPLTSLFWTKDGILPAPDAATQGARPVLGTVQALGGVA